VTEARAPYLNGWMCHVARPTPPAGTATTSPRVAAKP